MFAKMIRHYLVAHCLVTRLTLLALATIASNSAYAQPAVIGKWDKKFDWPNAGIHVHVLPTGKVLFWGRRDNGPGLDPHETTPYLWDPAKPDMTGFTKLEQPKNKNGDKFNLFCSGHTFMADGLLFVAGGHFADGQGVPYAAIFNYMDSSWARVDNMNGGRWYPTAVCLPDGGVLVCSGTKEDGKFNTKPQIWKDNRWNDNFEFNDLPWYPRLHIQTNGSVFMSGPLNLTQSLNTAVGGGWIQVGKRNGGDGFNTLMEYGSPVMFAKGKILFIGGGDRPTDAVKMIDLDGDRVWKDAKPMNFHRRQHNATILPDGSVLVTGGTQGAGFNNLNNKQPVHTAELWNPGTGLWTKMADEEVDRCYHSTAVLLPDGRVLSAGGGEYSPMNNGMQNDPKDTHKNAQIYSPPYLCRGGDRPEITDVQNTVVYNKTFDVGTSKPGEIDKVTWVRLSSVTHSFNSNQRINVLPFVSDGKKLTISAPPDARVCPPGHYMLFLLNKDNVPSIAKIVKIESQP